MIRCAVLAAACLAASAARAAGQEPSGEAQPLPPVEVTVTRDVGRSPLELPYAITRVQPDSARPGQRHAAVDELLLLLPGVAVANRHNPTQDPRIAIRGFGARSAFGVRSVRVLHDGVPLTLADGQTPVDYLDLESIGSVEVIRGAASSLYGNAAGGVVEFRSPDPPRDLLAASLRSVIGAFGSRRWTGSAGGSAELLRYRAGITRATSDGARDYSRQRTTHGSGRVSMRAGGTDIALHGLTFDMPVAQNPGALTRSELDATPRAAAPLNVARGARKAVVQRQLALSVHHNRFGTRDGSELAVTTYLGTRDLDNPLTFSVVAIDRRSYGASTRLTMPFKWLGAQHRLSAGADVQWLDDDRKNFANCYGVRTPSANCPVADGSTERGVVTLDQRERITSVGPFLRDEVELGARVRLSGGVRADRVRFAIRDRLITGPENPDESGMRTMRALSPMLGLVARTGLLTSVYASVSSSFETPTATELGNKPDGSAGVNPSLDPQYATTYELGMKGLLASRLRYDLAVFHTAVRDELVPYELADARRYFANAGRTRRQGLELGTEMDAGPITVAAAYSYSRFRFVDFLEIVSGTPSRYDGNRIPGVPEHQVQTAATWRQGTLFATLEAVVASDVFVDNGNTTRAAGHEVVHARAGGVAVFGRPWLSPTAGVQNIFGRRYVSSVVVNATGGRYYEPAPRRSWYVGLTAGLGQ